MKTVKPPDHDPFEAATGLISQDDLLIIGLAAGALLVFYALLSQAGKRRRRRRGWRGHDHDWSDSDGGWEIDFGGGDGDGGGGGGD